MRKYKFRKKRKQKGWENNFIELVIYYILRISIWNFNFILVPVLSMLFPALPVITEEH